MHVFKLIARFFMFAATPMYAFDPNDPADVALLDARIADAVAPLTKKNKELIAEVRTAKKGAEITPEQLAEVEAERDALASQVTGLDKELKTAKKAVEDNGKVLAGEQAYNQRLLVDNGLNAALLEAGVKNPAHIKAAAALIRASSKIDIVADGENRSAKIGDKALADAVKEWAGTDDGKAFVTAPVNGGGGAAGSNGAPPKPAPGGQPVTANMGGNKNERLAAIRERFPDLPT